MPFSSAQMERAGAVVRDDEECACEQRLEEDPVQEQALALHRRLPRPVCGVPRERADRLGAYIWHRARREQEVGAGAISATKANLA